MKAPYDLERVKLLSEAPSLFKKAIKAGWMSYPIGTEPTVDGSRVVEPHPAYDDHSQKHQCSANHLRKSSMVYSTSRMWATGFSQPLLMQSAMIRRYSRGH